MVVPRHHFDVERADRPLSDVAAVSILGRGAVVEYQGEGDHGGHRVKVKGYDDEQLWYVVAEVVEEPPEIYLITKFKG